MPHAGGVVPNWLIAGRYVGPKDVIPHLFEETDPGIPKKLQDIVEVGGNAGWLKRWSAQQSTG